MNNLTKEELGEIYYLARTIQEQVLYYNDSPSESLRDVIGRFSNKIQKITTKQEELIINN